MYPYEYRELLNSHSYQMLGLGSHLGMGTTCPNTVLHLKLPQVTRLYLTRPPFP